MPPPPSKRSPAVERGGKEVDSDPEVSKHTQAKVKISKGAEDDPEVAKHTQAKVKIASSTRQPVARGGGAVDDDPERSHRTEAKIKAQPRGRKGANSEAPKGKLSAEQAHSDPEYETGNAYSPIDDDASSDYHTGNDYAQLGDDKELNLEGDGLDALDADLGPPKTKALEVLLAEDGLSDVEEENANQDNETRAGPPLSLQITAGPDQGKKKKFKGVRMVIGRTPGVDLQLSDQSVSRRHVELVQGDKGVLLRDLGSGNGTKVNGEKTAEKILEHGDEIHIGKTKLKFVDDMAAFKKLRDDQQKKEAEEAEQKAREETEAKEKEAKEAQAPAEGADASAAAPGVEGDEAGPKTIARPAVDRADRKPIARRGQEATGVVAKFKALEPKKRRMLLGAVGMVLLLLIVIASATKAPAPQVVDPRQKLAAEKMQLARAAVLAVQYEGAIALIEAAEKLQPGIDQTKLASTARNELGIQRSLEAIKQMIEQNRFDDARSELVRLPQGALTTQERKKAVEDELVIAETKFKRQKIDDLLAAGELEGSRQLMAELPDEEQREVAGKIAEAEALAEDQKKQAELDARRAVGNRAAYQKSKAAEAMAIAFAVVQRKFAANEWQRAAAECDRVIDENRGDDAIRARAKQLQMQIPNFGRNYEEGMKKYREGQVASSAKPLRAARNWYLQIALPTALGSEIDEKLAQAAVMAGKEALMREDLATAAVNFKDAVKLDPNDGRARAGLDEVVNRADDLFQSAYMIRDSEPGEALRKFKVVVEVTPSGSSTHEKAKNLIAAMQR